MNHEQTIKDIIADKKNREDVLNAIRALREGLQSDEELKDLEHLDDALEKLGAEIRKLPRRRP